jgi:hypothetical protein
MRRSFRPIRPSPGSSSLLSAPRARARLVPTMVAKIPLSAIRVLVFALMWHLLTRVARGFFEQTQNPGPSWAVLAEAFGLVVPV